MALRARQATRAAAILAALAVVVAAARSPSLRAGYRAFRDPTLLEPRPPPEPPAPVSCARFTEEGRPRAFPLDPERAFDRAPIPQDLEDPDSAAVASFTLPDIHIPVTRRTLSFVRFFTTTEAGRAAFLQRYRRGGLYRETVAYELREAGLPEDLVWLAAIESGFDPRAVSKAGAAGLFQFMPDTAQLYGLVQDPWVDERRSLTRATKGAVTHLRDLYERFGRWDLALAAYNAGYDRVVSAIERVAKARGPMHLDDPPIDFSDLAAARALPEETINYVPQIMAFAVVAANRSRFGLDMPELNTPLELGEIAVPQGTRLRTIARAAGVSINVLRDYNPQILRDRVPPTGGDYLVAIPESRVQRALAAFPAYSEQEVVADHEPDADEGDPVTMATEGFTLDPSADEPLPRRPVALGKNRLPQHAIPGHERVLAAANALGISILEAKLPTSLSRPDLGWRRTFVEDPMSLFGTSHATPARAHEPALEKQLAFLTQPRAPVEALRIFTLPNGITVRVRHDKYAPQTAITVRIATLDDNEAFTGKPEVAPVSPARRGAAAAASEALHTTTVGKADVEAGIELSATRLRLLLGDTSAAQRAEIRFRAGNQRRKLLQKAPYGASWIALGEALFPPDHPMAGTVLGAASEGGALREMMVAEALSHEQATARASLTVVGDVDELRVKKLAESLLGPVAMPPAAVVGPHPRDDRLTVEEAVPAPRVLVGWIGPGEGEVGDASLRVAIEVLENQKFGLLSHVLGPVVSSAHADLEVWPRASIAVVELTPAPSREPAEALTKLSEELDRLGDEGPGANLVATAKYLLSAKVQKELSGRGTLHPSGLGELRHALRPWAADRARMALDQVTVGSVRAVIKRVMSREHRVVVTTVPKGAPR